MSRPSGPDPAGRARGLSPSVVSADHGRFADTLRAVEPFAARWHVDVMDGHYVPNLTIGPAHVETIASLSSLPQDVHLMVANPEETWEWYARAGAFRIAFHPETATHPAGLLQRIAAAGVGPGLAVNPDVAAGEVFKYLPLVDHLVVMTVYPGFSGQKFIGEVMPKLRELRHAVDDGGYDVHLIVDGGVSTTTGPACMEHGADVLVSASAVFQSADPAQVARELSEIVANGAVRP